MVESALIFETKYSERSTAKQATVVLTSPEERVGIALRPIILVTAPEEVKIAAICGSLCCREAITAERREKLEAEARLRLGATNPGREKKCLCDYVLTNGGPLTELEWQSGPALADPESSGRIRIHPAKQSIDGTGVTARRKTGERMARYNRIVSRLRLRFEKIRSCTR